MTTLYFDITTSLCWGGAPVGITRVEREIARRAPERSHHTVRYCVFHQPSGVYYELNRAIADRALAGECWLQIEDLRALPLTGKTPEVDSLSDLDTDQSDARMLAALHARLADMPLAEVLRLREDSPMIAVHSAGKRQMISARQLIVRPVPLRRDTWIVNGGLDWEHKNLRAIRGMKAKTGFRYVAILYDIIPLLLPHYVVPFYVDLLKRYFGELFWTADHALCISETTLEDVERHMADWRMPPLSMRAWPLGADIAAAEDAPGRLPAALNGKRYLLYVSTIEPRKSHRTIVEAFEQGVRDGSIPDDAVCVFVGRVGWNVENLIQEVRQNPVLTDRVLTLSGVPDEDLVELYRQARFVVFPSRYEGFGLALAEAMALGKACITSEAGSLREVGGEAPLYIDPNDIPRWAEALARAFNDDAMIADLEARSSREYTPVTWDDSADLFYAALNGWMDAA